MTRVLIAEVKQRKNFYRNLYYSSLNVLLWLLVLIIIFMLIDAFLILNQAQPKHFSTNTAGLNSELTVLDHPNETNNFLMPDETQQQQMPGNKNMDFDAA